MWEKYSVKTLFKIKAIGLPMYQDQYFEKDTALFEERIVMIKARSFDEAIKKAENEAMQYVHNYNSFCRINKYEQRLEAEYLEACDVFLIKNEMEVYSKTFLFKSDFDEKFIDIHLGTPDSSKKNKFMRKEYYEKYWKSSGHRPSEPLMRK